MTPNPSYREIPLTQGKVAKVSPHRYEYLSQFKWCASWNRCTRSFYALRRKNRKTLLMHRYILGLEFGDVRQADHRNHDTLDNTDDNLRISTQSQNHQNRGRQVNNKSGYKGVSFHNGKWRATIREGSRYLHLGYYETAEKAYDAYCQAAERLHGEFVHL